MCLIMRSAFGVGVWPVIGRECSLCVLFGLFGFAFLVGVVFLSKTKVFCVGGGENVRCLL